MIKVSFTGLRERLATLNRLEREQLPFAAALALTRTAQVVAEDLRHEMQVVFDRPTPATLDSLFIQPATKARMEAAVWIKDGRSTTAGGGLVGQAGKWGKGRAAIKWLTPEVFGGPRSEKGVEGLLHRKGVLQKGQYIMPGDAMKGSLDKYGNISSGLMTKMLSGAGLYTQVGHNANATDSKRSRAKGNARRFFVMYSSKGKPIGIVERYAWGKGTRSSIRMAVAFVSKRPAYDMTLDWFAVAERSAEENLAIEFEKAMAQALATRR